MCVERASVESKERIWEDREYKFCSEGGTVESPQHEALWRVVKRFKEVFAELPGQIRNYECVLKV